MKRLMIGLCGGTGSGKTTLARKIYNSLGSENAVLIGMDSYYKANWDNRMNNASKPITITLTLSIPS